jgi:hypothetical protein
MAAARLGEQALSNMQLALALDERGAGLLAGEVVYRVCVQGSRQGAHGTLHGPGPGLTFSLTNRIRGALTPATQA